MTRVFIRREPSVEPTGDVVLDAGSTLLTGEDDFVRHFGSIDRIETDVLTLISSVFAADRAIPRGRREDLCREIELDLPVYNAVRLTQLAPDIESVLYALSNDSWTVRFREHKGDAPPDSNPFQPAAVTSGRVLLFSGGLDSLAAAIEFAGDGLTLVSHRTRNRFTGDAQEELANLLANRSYGGAHLPFFVSSRDGGPVAFDHAAESSQRTRSFMFLALAALVARRVAASEVIFLAENGQMAIHLPLTAARIGAFSTHTAHPDVLAKMSSLISKLLTNDISIVNPYVHKTKAEVIEPVVNQLPEALVLSHSCWRNARLPRNVTHCGECIPCFVRRVAIEFYTTDPTQYGRDLWDTEIGSLGDEDIGRRNLVDLCEFIVRLEALSNDEAMHEWPELYSSNIQPEDALDMYRRFCAEARTVLGRHSQLQALLE